MGSRKAMTIKDLLMRESAAQVFAMTCEADLAHRMRVASERRHVPDERIIPFFAIMPDSLDVDERRKWIKEINEGLEAVVADAHKSIMVDRTIKTMVDLGLGDDGEGGTRED